MRWLALLALLFPGVAFGATVVSPAVQNIERRITTIEQGGFVDDCAGPFFRYDRAAKRWRCVTYQRCDPTQGLAIDESGALVCRSFSAPAVVPEPAKLLAFPGCEGSGCNATGGRGGVVYSINSLADTTGACQVTASGTTAGTCTLRDAVEATGPRIAIFRTSGTINLTKTLIVSNPGLTVAGHAAPGGIQISGRLIPGDNIHISTHDVIWRYTRSRHGMYLDPVTGDPAPVSQAGNTLALKSGAYNVVIDHNTFSWNLDELLILWSANSNAATAIRDVTASWNIFGHSLSHHPTSHDSGAGSRAVADAMTNIDWHHNYAATSGHRVPQFSAKSLRYVNNIIYNWGYFASNWVGGGSSDWISNLWKRGPQTPTSGSRTHELVVFPGGTVNSANGDPSIYFTGNKGPNHADPAATSAEWDDMVRAQTGYQDVESGLLSTSYKRAQPLAASIAPITVTTAGAALESLVLPVVGASRRLDCDGNWVASRDTTDTQLVADYSAVTGGSTPVTEAAVGGFPTMPAGTACTDTDKDGMPDAWETANGLNINDPADRNGTGVRPPYTNLEAYLAGSTTGGSSGGSGSTIATMGRAAPGDEPGTFPYANASTCSIFTAPASGTVSTAALYHNSESATAKTKAIIYSVAANQPGALLAASTEVTGTAVGTWTSYTFAAPLSVTQGTSYCLGVIADTQLSTLRVKSTGLNFYQNTSEDAYADGPETSWAPMRTSPNQIPAYATITVSP